MVQTVVFGCLSVARQTTKTRSSAPRTTPAQAPGAPRRATTFHRGTGAALQQSAASPETPMMQTVVFGCLSVARQTTKTDRLPHAPHRHRPREQPLRYQAGICEMAGDA